MTPEINKIIMSVIIVTIFLLSSTKAAPAELPLAGRNDSPSDDIAGEPIVGYAQQQSQSLGPSQPSQPVQKKYAVICVSRYFGLWYFGMFQFNPLNFYKYVQQYYTWYLNDAGKMYRTLKDIYGYNEENIFVLVKLLPSYFKVPSSFDPEWRYDDFNEQNLETLLNRFQPEGDLELSEDDSLFFCFIDHGGNENVGGWDYDDEWPSPEMHEDEKYWKHENYAYDNDTNTKAVFNPSILEYNRDKSEFLTLKLDSSINIKGFRIRAKYYKAVKIGETIIIPSFLDKMELYFYKDNAYRTKITFDKWPDDGWLYHDFNGIEYEVNKVLIRFYKNSNLGFLTHPAKITEFDFWDINGCGEVGSTYFGCPFESIPDVVKWIFGNDVQKLYDYELAEYMGENSEDTRIKGTIIYALHPCFSGGFIHELSGDKRIICSSVRGFELDDGWMGPFRRALNKTDDEGYSLMEDVDLYPVDGKVSILEAYMYAADYVSSIQYALIDDNEDDIGHHFCETDYFFDITDPDNPSRDGSLAADTFL